MSERTILIADDEKPVRNVFIKALENEHYKILQACNGKEAVDIAQNTSLDLAILDIQMPEMNGVEALKAIKAIQGSTEAIVLTGHADMESLHEMILNNGAYDYLLKPINVVELKHCIQKALEKRDLVLKEDLMNQELERRIKVLEAEYREKTYQLRQSQIKYETIVEHSTDGILVVQDGVVKFANKRVLEATGYTREAYIGTRIIEQVHPEDRAVIAQRAEPQHKGRELPSVYTIRALKKGGGFYWAEVSAVETLWEGRPATLNFVRDISEGMEQLEALRIKDAALSASINGIAFLDLDGNVTYVNRAFLNMWGYDREAAVVGAGMAELWKNPDAGPEIMRMLQGQGAWVGEMEAVRRDGARFDAQVSATMVKDETGVPITLMASFLDVTPQKQMMEEIRQSDKLSSLGQLAAGLAHELRNPLAVVSSCSQFCLDNISLDRMVKENFQVIHRNARRASELIHDLLTFARPTHFEWGEVELNEVIRKMLRMARLETRSAGIEYKLRFAKYLPPLTGDSDKLGQVFLNLIQNAIQAVSSDGMITIRTQLKKGQNQIEAHIIDNGPGIPEEYRAKIFDPFFTTKDRGTGLGLSICHTIVTQHGGSIIAENNTKSGVKVCVSLPLASKKRGGKI
ncbi:MAG: PAS domain S-box protein [Deltaproteobacteria bacterium]|nr:PAS domain S-box protein [Deltaproteobacteria bacterium]